MSLVLVSLGGIPDKEANAGLLLTSSQCGSRWSWQRNGSPKFLFLWEWPDQLENWAPLRAAWLKKWVQLVLSQFFITNYTCSERVSIMRRFMRGFNIFP